MKKDYKEGVDFVFEQNPELAKIGTEQDYSEYIKTIFPESKVKDIVYHGSKKGEKLLPILKLRYGNKIEGFSEEDARNYKRRIGHRGANKAGFYFSPSPEKKFKAEHEIFTDFYWDGAKNYGKYIYPVVLNLKNPANSDFALGLTEEIKNKLKKKGYDSVIGTSDMTSAGIGRDMELTKEHINFKSVVEYGAFEPSQIHILGSKQDIEGFRKYIKNKNKGNSLEGKVISGFFILSFLAGLVLIPLNLTGNIIGTSGTAHKLIGIILTLLGISGFFIYKKLSQ
jgi:hypothetical protein